MGAAEHRAGEGGVKMFTPSGFLEEYQPHRRHAVDNPPGV